MISTCRLYFKLNYFLPPKTRYWRFSKWSLIFITLLLSLFVTPAGAYDVVIAWDPNDEPNLAGYVLYVDDGISEILYEYIDSYPLEELDPQNPRVKITDLSEDLAYYFVVTAYDADGNESDYSDEICVINGEPCPQSWLAYREQPVNPASVSTNKATSSSAGSFGSSGGSGGSECFISTINYTEKNTRLISQKQTFLLLAFLILMGIIQLLNKTCTNSLFKRNPGINSIHKSCRIRFV